MRIVEHRYVYISSLGIVQKVGTVFSMCGHFSTQCPNVLLFFIAFALRRAMKTRDASVSTKSSSTAYHFWCKNSLENVLLTLLFVRVCFMSWNLEQRLPSQIGIFVLKHLYGIPNYDC